MVRVSLERVAIADGVRLTGGKEIMRAVEIDNKEIVDDALSPPLPSLIKPSLSLNRAAWRPFVRTPKAYSFRKKLFGYPLICVSYIPRITGRNW